MSIASQLRKDLRAISKDRMGLVAYERHMAAIEDSFEIERGLIKVLDGLAFYADSYQRIGSHVADDGHLGPHFREAAEFVRAALSNQCGRLDGGTTDHAINNMLKACGYAIE